MPSSVKTEPMDGESEIQVRVYPGASQEILIYLPGTHGDWTLIGSFRKALAGRMRFVELTYPRTLTWTIEDYAANVQAALLRHGITGGWVLGESFSSQVAWALARRSSFMTQGIILAGGFVRHPARCAVRGAVLLAGKVPLGLIAKILFGYAKIARYRFRNAPEVATGIEEFIARRTELDRQAATHRLQLIFQNDARAAACAVTVPLYALSGWIDPVVPWFPVRGWLRKNCPSLRDYRIIGWADHNVLGTAPQISADLVVKWIQNAGIGS